MLIAIILILVAVALFLIFRDDHDDSYTKGDRKTARESGQKSVYQKSATPRRAPAAQRPAPVMSPGSSDPHGEPRTIVPKEKVYGDPLQESIDRIAALDYHFLDRIIYDPTLPERTMSSFIAGIGSHCSNKDVGGLVGYVTVDKATGAMEVRAGDDNLVGYLPMKDRAVYHAFNPTLAICPFAGHVGLSTTGRLYADIRIVLPSTSDFVEESLTGFLG